MFENVKIVTEEAISKKGNPYTAVYGVFPTRNGSTKILLGFGDLYDKICSVLYKTEHSNK